MADARGSMPSCCGTSSIDDRSSVVRPGWTVEARVVARRSSAPVHPKSCLPLKSLRDTAPDQKSPAIDAVLV